MRIGVVVPDWSPEAGGGSTFISSVVEALLEHAKETSHTFVLVCTSSWKQNQQDTQHPQIEYSPLPYNRLLDGTPGALLRKLPGYETLSGTYSPPLERAALLERLDLLWYVAGGSYEPVDIPYIATVWDIQHCTHPWFPEVSSRGRWEHRERLHFRFLKRAIRVITGTTVGRNELTLYYQIPPERICINPHPTPDLCGGKSPERPVWANKIERQKFFVYPAQFWAHKNHTNLVHALPILEEKTGNRIHLVLTGGDQGNQSHVRNVISDSGLADRIHLPGFVPNLELAWLYTHAAALVYPSFSGPENLPPLEALSMQCPVVISNYPGAKEQLENAALYFDPHCPIQMAEAMARVLDHPDESERKVAEAKAILESRTGEQFVRNVFSLIHSLEPVRRCWPLSSKHSTSQK